MVLVEKVGKQKYRASTAQPIVVEAGGRTRDEAVERPGALVRKRLAEGELVEISLNGTREDNPWPAFAGVWQDHPDWDAFLKNRGLLPPR